MTLRILIVASEVPPLVSGVARSVGDLADGLRQRGHTVDVLSAADAPYARRGDFRFSALGWRTPELRRRMADYDIVNVHGPAPTISEVFLLAFNPWRRSGNPAVVYTHHFTMEMPQRWLAPAVALYNRVLLRLARAADTVVVTSASYARIVSQAGISSGTVIPWGINGDRNGASSTEIDGSPELPPTAVCRDRADREPADRLRVLYVGQLRPYKGADVAVEAVGRLDGVTLKIIGSGPLAERLGRQAADVPSGNVELLGFRPDEELRCWYRWADVVVLPSTSRLEAFGIVLLEGMSAGCVPVASDLPGVRDLVATCGLVATPGDADDLAWALELLASQPELLAHLSVAAVERARSFTVDHTVDRYAELFERLDAARS
jgi:glycosyltransferase involved in cell wall biosynthesis